MSLYEPGALGEAVTTAAPTQRRLRDVRPLFLLYSVWRWVGYIPLLALSTVVMGSIALVFSALRLPKAANGMGVVWSRFNAYMAPMLVRVRGREHLDPAQSYVIVSNHQSQFDIFALYGWLGVPFRWVMKAELRKVPFLGAACFHMGHVFIDRSNKAAAWASIEAARERVRGGVCILFFPEGTRSNDGRLLPFKNGAFRFALDIGLPVLPVTLKGTKDILPNRTLCLFPGRAEIVFHEPIHPTRVATPELDPADASAAIDDLATRARHAIESGLR